MTENNEEVARTAVERRAIARLEKLAETWPQTLTLFAWSGTLVVFRSEDMPGNDVPSHTIFGIPIDGGDP